MVIDEWITKPLPVKKRPSKIVVPLHERTQGLHEPRKLACSGPFVGTRVDTRRRCVQCKKAKCYFICEKCDKALCIADENLVEGTMSCWALYHSEPNVAQV
jgi:hypothetical protein